MGVVPSNEPPAFHFLKNWLPLLQQLTAILQSHQDPNTFLYSQEKAGGLLYQIVKYSAGTLFTDYVTVVLTIVAWMIVKVRN